MKFVDTHFTKHHLFHTPHKWFMAFLISPIHAAEMHYKKRYHLSFRHAKKLFLFDMLLVLSTLFLALASILWYTYDPTVTDLVSLSLTPSQERVRSGDHVTYTIFYKNHSDVLLKDSILFLDLPEGFILDTPVADNFLSNQTAFNLGNIKTQQEGTLTFTGYFFDIPDTNIDMFLRLKYTQEGRKKHEIKTHKSIHVLRDSILVTQLNIHKTTILGTGQIPIKITLKNDGDIDLKDITIPLSSLDNPYYNITIPKTTDTLVIPNLPPTETKTIDATLHTYIPKSTKEFTVSLIPLISVSGKHIPQEPATETLNVKHPEVQFSTTWENEQLSPGEKTSLILTLHNTGNTTLHNASIDIPLPETLVSLSQFRANNTAILSGNTARFTADTTPALSSIEAGQTIEIKTSIPIIYVPKGINPTLTLSPTLHGSIAGISYARYTTKTQTTPLTIGTQLLPKGRLIYYTNEGDQLGRGSLPPIVGKETKYWAMIEITNTTNAIGNVSLTATLPNHVKWTGRTSVSHGNDIVYNKKTRQISWINRQLGARQTAGIYMELALTPEAIQQGTSPTMLTNIVITATDLLLNKQMTRTIPSLDISLPEDPIGRKKGNVVQ
ncbi:MAG: hypothetical protein HOE80_01045 [Candidatus Magasanikbacteria bacterium]|mgnify:CR=1 FL=1|jgi:hypothetical protein|nr:hypothetical protein [Candidatus Magasanikbacteria bacterium]MBT4071290.1 hypothetical protein [Candidatus Magasanikbacteria bacterium]